MLPNHAPLMVAEAFGTLATLFPDRIDLGLGRAPGTDMATARALRRHLDGGDSFPQDVVELLGYFADDPGRAGAGDPRHRHRRAGLDPRLQPLRRPARRASRPALRLRLALRARPTSSRRSRSTAPASARRAHLDAPYLMLAFNVFAADSDAEGRRLRTSMQQAFANLRTGRPGPLPRPVDDIAAHLDPMAIAMVDRALSCSATGVARRPCAAT